MKNNTYQKPKQKPFIPTADKVKPKNTARRKAAIILLCLFSFWTLGSILGALSFFGVGSKSKTAQAYADSPTTYANEVEFVSTFDMLFSTVWASTFNPEATSYYSNNISPIRLFFNFYRGTGDWGGLITLNALYYSNGGQTVYELPAFTYSSTYNTSSFDYTTYGGGLLPEYNYPSTSETWADSGWFSLVSDVSGLSNALICPMRIRYTKTFMSATSDDFIDSVAMSQPYYDTISGGYRVVNRLSFYSKTGTCHVDFMMYFDTDSGNNFLAFSENTFYFREYVDLVAIRNFQQGKEEGYQLGYIAGYDDGYGDGVVGAADYTFFSLIAATVDAPITAIFGLLNFEFLGVNLWQFFTGLLTCTLIIAVIRLLL